MRLRHHLGFKRGLVGLGLSLVCFSGVSYSNSVDVLKVIDRDLLLVQERVEVESPEMHVVGSALKNLKRGSFRLQGIYLEPGDEKMFPNESVSRYGKMAMGFIEGKLSLGKWALDTDPNMEVDENGVPCGYLVNEKTGEVLNVELVRAGLSPYYFENGFSRKYHMDFVGAMRESFHAYRGIWSDTLRREYYYDLNFDTAMRNGLMPPTFAHGIHRAEDIGEDPTIKEFLVGVLIVLGLFILGNTETRFKKLSSRKSYEGFVWRRLKRIPLFGVGFEAYERKMISLADGKK